ncbi:MAG TPA: hypothetical protein VFX24_06775 [Ktedonobacterales bacterium]|jgi:hypothetical protein|nr:hypothetical protein [Ktedonobacterales bacterium]
MSISAFRFSGKRRLITVVLAAVALIALIAVVAFNIFHTRTAYGAGVGPGICSPNAPVCTINGNSGYADFGSVSSDGCITTDVALEPTQSFSNPGSTTDQFVLVFFSKYDQCNDVQIELGANFDPNTGNSVFTGASQFGNSLSSASVIGTAPIYDVNTGDLLFTANIDVAWQGNGSTLHNNDNEHFKSPGMIVTTNIHGTSRPAVASGVFTDETGTNVAAEPTSTAALFDSHGSQVIIAKP